MTDWAWLGFVAAAIHLVTFAVYNLKTFRGKSIPNMATWTLWVFLSALGTASYIRMTGDWAKCILSVAGTTACIITFAFALAKGRMSRLDKWDKVVLAGGIMAGIVWWLTRSATYANLILQVCFAVSFIPTVRQVTRLPWLEEPLPWLLWTASHAVNLAVVILRWQGSWPDAVFPVNAIVCHAAVGVIAGWPRLKGLWLARKMNWPVICQKWKEIEPGWGTRPDAHDTGRSASEASERDNGYSIHLNEEDRQKFVAREETPYFTPDGAPYECMVEEKKFRDAMRKSKDAGKWFPGSPPYPQGVDGRMDSDRGRLSYWRKK